MRVVSITEIVTIPPVDPIATVEGVQAQARWVLLLLPPGQVLVYPEQDLSAGELGQQNTGDWQTSLPVDRHTKHTSARAHTHKRERTSVKWHAIQHQTQLCLHLNFPGKCCRANVVEQFPTLGSPTTASKPAATNTSSGWNCR